MPQATNTQHIFIVYSSYMSAFLFNRHCMKRFVYPNMFEYAIQHSNICNTKYNVQNRTFLKFSYIRFKRLYCDQSLPFSFLFSFSFSRISIRHSALDTVDFRFDSVNIFAFFLCFFPKTKNNNLFFRFAVCA